MKPIQVLIAILFSVMTSTAFAVGGWSSGGSELLKDTKNPWFLRNITDVSYCVVVDAQNFGVAPTKIKEQLGKAFEFWRTEFQKSTNGKSLGIAQQNFHEVSCNGPVDIRFQFGVLSEKQKRYLQNPTKYAAVTVRTEYSASDMHGKGFVYVSPMKGALAYNPERSIPDAWTRNDSEFLYLTLLHELGHVFGLPHMGSIFGELMSESFAESLIARENTDFGFRPSFFSLSTGSRTVCATGELLRKWREFFELPSGSSCVKFVFEHPSKNELFGVSKLKVYVSKSQQSEPTLVAEAPLMMNRFNPSFVNRILLPAGQKVFREDERIPGTDAVLGVGITSVAKHGSFLTAVKKERRHLTVRFEQGRQAFAIDGVGPDGDIITIL